MLLTTSTKDTRTFHLASSGFFATDGIETARKYVLRKALKYVRVCARNFNLLVGSTVRYSPRKSSLPSQLPELTTRVAEHPQCSQY